MSTPGVKGGPAFEIRFCKGNKVQVFDLSKRWDASGKQPLPNEYLEDDVVNGRLRYSKLGNQWITSNTMEAQQRRQQQQPPVKIPAPKPDVVPALAKQRAIDEAKELEHIRQAQEAMQKAMDRKKKIQMARCARKKGAASNPNMETLAGNKDEDKTDTRVEQMPSNNLQQVPEIKSAKVTKKPSFLHELDLPPTTPLPNRQPNNYNAINNSPIASLDHKRQSISPASVVPTSRQGDDSFFHHDTTTPKQKSSIWCCIIS